MKKKEWWIVKWTDPDALQNVDYIIDPSSLDTWNGNSYS